MVCHNWIFNIIHVSVVIVSNYYFIALISRFPLTVSGASDQLINSELQQLDRKATHTLTHTHMMKKHTLLASKALQSHTVVILPAVELLQGRLTKGM